MNLQSTTNLLVCNLREELAAKRALDGLIEEQERAVGRSDMRAFEEVLERMRAALDADQRREAARATLMERFARYWQVSAETLTLASVARRLGERGAELAELRGELREAVAGLARRNRRLSALLGMHRRLNRDVLQVVLGVEDGVEPTSAGHLIDAQA